jgi:hypothetical protein
MFMVNPRMWYVAIGGEAVGPIRKEELLMGLRSGDYDGETMVYAQGMTDWAPVADVSELAVPSPRERNPPRQVLNEEKRMMSQQFAEVTKRFDRNNRPFERLKRPILGAQAQRNFEQCMSLWDGLRAQEDRVNQAWLVAQVYCRDLEDYALGRHTAEQEYLDVISPSRESAVYYPPGQPTDASHARLRALEQKKNVLENLLVAVRDYNEQVRAIRRFYRERVSRILGLPGFVSEVELPREIELPGIVAN